MLLHVSRQVGQVEGDSSTGVQKSQPHTQHSTSISSISISSVMAVSREQDPDFLGG
jgi:hypothetical protein